MISQSEGLSFGSATGGETRLPLVSILIPAYNAEQWIGQCIESALLQSYANKEVVVIDDGSTDGTVAEIQRFGDQVRFVRMAHAGANAVRNHLTQLAKGEWVQYLDADDYLLPGKILDQICFLERHCWRFDIVYSPMILRNETTGTECVTSIDPPYDTNVQFLRWVSFCTHGILARRSAILEAGGWLTEQPVCQEHELLFRMLTMGRSFGVWNHAAAVYRYHSADTISHRSPLRTMRARMAITNRFEAWLAQNKAITPAHRREAFKARMDTARSAWPYDEFYSEELARAAGRHGQFWLWSHPSLPLHFQVFHRLLGFRAAQRLAAFVRAQKKRSELKQRETSRSGGTSRARVSPRPDPVPR